MKKKYIIKSGNSYRTTRQFNFSQFDSWSECEEDACIFNSKNEAEKLVEMLVLNIGSWYTIETIYTK
jgi:hypothetical protein